MKTHNIAVIGGDGTGPEVIREAIKVLSATSIKWKFTSLNYNGTRYLETGITLTKDELNNLKTYDAILLGAIGHTDVKPGILEKEILLKLRFELDQYINLRPIKLYENVPTPIKNIKPSDIDYLVVRENTGGLYTGNGGFSAHGTQHEVATQSMIYTYHQVKRCILFAFEQARKRKLKGSKGKVTLCGKTNVLTFVYDLWERVLNEVSKNYPDIQTDYVHVDAVCIYMIENPKQFDVIVTGNMFGDIITDLAAVTQGGMGVAPGANINPEGVSMFEPIGGTAPLFTGKNEINPIAAIGAAQLMCTHLGEEIAANQIETGIIKTLKTMKSMAAGKMGYSTSEIGDHVVKNMG